MGNYNRDLTEEKFENNIRNSFILDGNKYYNNGKKGISDCCNGRYLREGANVLCNCVGFAWGAYNELWAKIDGNHKGFKRVRGNANEILEKAKKDEFFKNYVLPVESYPPLGGLIVWEDIHVAYIAEVIDKDTIVIIQSGYVLPGNEGFDGWTVRNEANTGWVCDSRTIHRDENGKNHWYYRKNSSCLGFLANPAIIQGVYTPEIKSILQTTPTNINIVGSRNANPPYATHTKIYYRWDEPVKLDNNDEVITTYDENFNLNIIKPREAKLIFILPININSKGEQQRGNITSKELHASYPCIQIKDDGVVKNATPYIYTNDNGWEEAIPTLRKNMNWYKLYNTDSERVK